MKKLTAVCILAFAATAAVADTVRADDTLDLSAATQRFRITYTNGDRENYIVEYRAHLQRYAKETGEAWTLRHPFDDRACEWNFRSFITRKVYLINRAGVRFEQPGLAKPFERQASGRGGGFVLLVGHAQTCNDAMGSFEQQSATYAGEVNSVLGPTMQADSEVVKRDIGATIQGVSAVEAI